MADGNWQNGGERRACFFAAGHLLSAIGETLSTEFTTNESLCWHNL